MIGDLRRVNVHSVKVEADPSLRAQARAFAAPDKFMSLVLMRAINYGGDRGFTALKPALLARTGVKPSDLNRRRGLYTVPARPVQMRYDVVARSRWTPLGYYSPVQTPLGVAARPWNRPHVFPRLFVVRMASGYVGVFRRKPNAPKVQFVSRVTGKAYKAAPLQERWGPSLARELGRGDIPDVFFNRAQPAVQQRLPHEIAFALQGTGPNRRRP